MYLELRIRQQPNIWCSLRGSKACLLLDGEAVPQSCMSGISVRCILKMSDGKMESTSGGVDKVEVLGCLKVGVAKGAGCVSFV